MTVAELNHSLEPVAEGSLAASPGADKAEAADGRSVRLIALAVSATAMGYSLHLYDNSPTDDTILLLTVAFVASAIGVWGFANSDFRRLLPQLVVPAVCLCLAFQFRLLLIAPHPENLTRFEEYTWGIVAAETCCAAIALRAPAWKTFFLPVLLAIYLFMGLWVVHTKPNPPIDVFLFHQDAISALQHGHNPYEITVPNIYGDDSFYGKGLVKDSRVLFGFPYPPVSLLAAVPGRVLAGDHRYSNVVALTLAAGLIAYALPGNLGALAAALMLFTPRTFFIIEMAWTEPFVILFLAGTLFAAHRSPRWVFVPLGLLLFVKPYLIVVAPLIVLLLPRPFDARATWSLFWRSCAVGLAVSLPFILWNPEALYHSALVAQFEAPFRGDSLSYVAWLEAHGHAFLPHLTGFVAAIPLLGLGVRFGRRSPASFAAWTALVLFGFFALNRQAFVNYYFFVIAALCCGIALEPVENGEAPQAVIEPVAAS